ncbi:hypothetical protein DERP_006741 [Dermatophagoides pteronyssinus]|uniref:Uncharacterized protein n=1 Tax=Dermatophagoides pteronyssinus TaxID=6956 RepID=A0ABQ8IRV5_DERPT|nr:hypothetical protein DERP_006741 [Dermatophagoides pteronyssinus]
MVYIFSLNHETRIRNRFLYIAFLQNDNQIDLIKSPPIDTDKFYILLKQRFSLIRNNMNN